MSDTEYSESIEVGLEENERNEGMRQTLIATPSSTSSEESSTSISSDSDNSAEEDSYELTKISKHVLHLPKGLCENASVFREFFSLDTWRSLPIPVQNHLQQFLPRFSQLLPPQLDAVEQTRTLSMLFNGRLQRFGQTPLSILQRELERGNYRPDILKLRQNIAKSNRREQRFRQCERLSQLAKQLFLSRQRLIDTAYQSSPDTVIKVQQRAPPQPKATQLYADNKLSAIRARKRFYGEISQMAEQLGLKRDDLSADEEGEDKLTIEELKDDSLVRTSAEEIIEAAKSTANLVDRCVYGTLFKRQKELDDEEACRLQQGSKQLRLCNKNFRNYLRDHKRRKLTEPTLPEFETSDIRLRDVCARAQMGGNFKRIFALGKTQGRKPKQPTTSTVTRTTPTTASTECTATISSHISPIGVKLSEPPALVPIQPLKKSEIYRTTPSHLPSIHKESLASQPNNFSDMMTEDHEAFNMLDSEVELQQEEVETFSGTCEETIPAFVISNDAPAQQKPSQQLNSGAQVASGERPPLPKLEPISNNHLKHHRVSAAKVIISPSSNTSSNGSSELIQETHSSFFSLIRDFFCSTPNYRMRYDELKIKIDIWLRNPITALNEWYSMADNWSFLLRSAINFLVGDFTDLPDEYVPYIEFKNQISIYQWIGAGRDSDKRLTSLCQTWLEKRRQYEQGAPFNLQKQQGWDGAGLSRSILDNEDSSGAYDCNSTEGGIAPPPPPPRYPTTWKVKSASPAEMLEFQRQERERFEKPHRAYTYRMHGYESVVGPVKGIYTAMLAMTKARGHSMMVGDRPNFVTILTLVRDATARLPNGEGTRADISELLKCSQYINRDAAENVLQTIVSGALDRMHTEHDPCVRYDPKRKIWIYLHRNRTEEEFERLHQQNQCVGKVKKLIPRKPRTPTNLKTEVSISETPSKTFTDTTQSAAVLLPALVPSTSLATNNNIRRQQQQQQPPQQQHQQLLLGNKCLPVPPLKYNIPPHTISTGVQQQQQHQKSLLKSNIRQENNSVGTNTSVIVQNATATSTNKHYSYPMTQTNMTSTSGNSNNNSNTATPIIVATPQGLHTVRVANATTHEANVAMLSPGSATPGQTTVKRMPLSKSIIINPIAQQQQQQQQPSTTVNSNYKLANTKSSSQAIKQTATQHRLTSSASAPSNASQLSNSHTDGSGIMIPLSMANAANVHSTSSAMVIQTTTSPPIMQNKNFLRLVQTSSAAKPPSQSTCQIVSRQRILASTNLVATSTPSLTSSNNRLPTSVQFQQPISKAPSGLQITSNTNTSTNTNLITIGSGPNDVGGGAANAAGTTSVVRMSAQAFANLQQKQQLQQRVTIKSGNSQTPITAASKPPQRLILGNTTVLAAPIAQSAQKNIVLQQLPIVVAKSAANTSTPTTPMATSKIQTINTSNLTPQQQRVLIQNLKQQNNSATQTQYKTVQILNANSSQHQQQQSSRSPILNAQQQVGKTLAVMVSQSSPIPQAQQQASTITRIIKTNPTQVKTEASATSNTRMISSSGQVVSLESLLQKKGNALRITGPSNAAVTKTNQTTAGNVQHKITVTPQQQQQQQQQTQYAVMSMAQPINNNNIINLGGTTLTMGQRLVATQANDNSSGSKAVATTNTKIVRSSDSCTTPINRIVTASNKPLSKTVVTPASIGSGNIRVINASGQMSNLNLASLQGKQVVFTSANPAQKQLTNVIKNQTPPTSVVQQQSGNVMISGQAVKLQQVINKSGNIVNAATTSVAVGSCSNTAPVQTLLIGNQVLRVHQMPQIVTTSAAANNKTNDISNQKSGGASTSKTIFLGSTGQTLRLQSNLATGTTLTNKNIVIQRSNANSNQQNNANVSCKVNNAGATTSTPNRVVLAVQGGGQIFLSPTFQGGNLNLKSLQNMKLVSLTNQSNVKDVNVLSPTTTKATNS